METERKKSKLLIIGLVILAILILVLGCYLFFVNYEIKLLYKKCPEGKTAYYNACTCDYRCVKNNNEVNAVLGCDLCPKPKGNIWKVKDIKIEK